MAGRHHRPAPGCIGNRVYTDLGDDELYVVVPGRDMARVAASLDAIISANDHPAYLPPRPAFARWPPSRGPAMRRRAMLATMLLGTLVAADGVAAGGPVGLSVRGRFSGGDVWLVILFTFMLNTNCPFLTMMK